MAEIFKKDESKKKNKNKKKTLGSLFIYRAQGLLVTLVDLQSLPFLGCDP
jgi:hypothetical protein